MPNHLGAFLDRQQLVGDGWMAQIPAERLVLSSLEVADMLDCKAISTPAEKLAHESDDAQDLEEDRAKVYRT
eukprot:9877103-Alexandrium_andersonii.AAC.1